MEGWGNHTGTSALQAYPSSRAFLRRWNSFGIARTFKGCPSVTGCESTFDWLINSSLITVVKPDLSIIGRKTQPLICKIEQLLIDGISASDGFRRIRIDFSRGCIYKPPHVRTSLARRQFRLPESRPSQLLSKAESRRAARRGIKINEAHLSAVQACPQAPSWFPLPHGNAGRTQSHRSTPRPRPQAAFRLNPLRATGAVTKIP